MTSRRVRLVVLLGVSTLLKLLLLVPASGLPQRGDEQQYVAGAIAIAETGVPAYPNPVWDEAHASPLYPYGLGALVALFGPAGGLLAARIAQVVLSTLTVLFVYSISRRIWDERNAFFSATVAAFWPTSIAFTHYFFTETVYTFFLVGLVALLLAHDAPGGQGAILVAGIAGGLAALTRSVFVTQAPFVALWLLTCGARSPRARVLRAGLFALGLVLVIAPWTARNAVRYERFLLIDTNAGNVLYKNWNAIRPENYDVGLYRRWNEEAQADAGPVPLRKRVEVEHFVDRDRAEVRAAMRFTLAHPLLFARNSVIRAAELFNPTSFLVRSIRFGDYRGLPAVLGEALVWSVLAGNIAVLALGTLGLARPLSEARRLPALLIAANVLVCVLTISMSRYRFPMMPLLIPFAVDAGLHLRSLAVEYTWRLWLALAALAAMVAAWVAYVPLSL